MRYVIDKTAPEAAYLQLYRQLREDIRRQVYPRGTRLPSKRLLAQETGVSTITVEHTYELLCDEGYAEARERSGYFVSFRTDQGFAAVTETAALTMPHSTGSDRQFPVSVLAKTMRKVINDLGDGLLEKSPNPGFPQLREAIRGYLRRSRGIEADLDQIIIGSGSEYLYGLTVELLGRDRVYAIESPSYNKIRQVYQASDVRCELLHLGADGIESSVQGRYLVEDDFESEFSLSGKPWETLFSHSTDHNVIYLNSFSKTVSSGLRVGYMVLPKHLVPEFQKKLGFYSCTVPTFEQFVLAALITSGDFERHINRVRRQKRREKQQISAGRN